MLKRVKPVRQIQIAELMVSVNNFTSDCVWVFLVQLGSSLPERARGVLSSAMPHEGAEDPVVEVLAVGGQDEGEIAADVARDLLGEHDHGVGLAAALSVPEDAQAANPISPPDGLLGDGMRRGDLLELQADEVPQLQHLGLSMSEEWLDCVIDGSACRHRAESCERCMSLINPCEVIPSP